MTATARTYAIAAHAAGLKTDAEIYGYFLSLPKSDRALFDNATDYITSVMMVRKAA